MAQGKSGLKTGTKNGSKKVMKKAPKAGPRSVSKKGALRVVGKGAGAKAGKAPGERMSLGEVMRTLEKLGTAQARKTYARHGATGEVFGVSFGDLKKLLNRIGVDQELAEALWETGNFDARNLAAKVCDPMNFPPAVLDAWAAVPIGWLWGGYVGQIAAEGPRGKESAEKWLKAKDDATRTAGWCAVGAMAMIDAGTPDAWFEARLGEIEKGIGAANNRHKYVMNNALIAIGCRSAAMRKAATSAAKRIGTIQVDHGDTDCKTPDAVERMEKSWERAKGAGFASPAEQERGRESMRTRC